MVELEHTRSLLSKLGLDTASELLDAKLEDAMHKDATYLSFLSELLGAEMQEKKRRSEETRIKLSRLPHRKTLEEFDFGFQPSIDTRQIKELSTLAFVARDENVIFFRSSRCRQDSSCGRPCDASPKVRYDGILH
jgi:DNA replication protein DnaC